MAFEPPDLCLFCGWLLALWFMDRMANGSPPSGESSKGSSRGQYLAPRFALVVLGLLLFLLASFIVASPERLRPKIIPMFVTLTGLVFVGPLVAHMARSAVCVLVVDQARTSWCLWFSRRVLLPLRLCTGCSGKHSGRRSDG